MRSNRHILMLGAVAAALMPGMAFADVGEPAGVAGAVSGAVGIVSPAKQITAPVAVNSGDGIVMGDGLSTGAESRLQVMLLDESAITVGPDAELTIDEFVYDPAKTNANALSASIAKGAFRLVTGAIARQNPEGTEINLPNAVLTIRGTTVIGACAATCFVALAGSGDENTAGKKPSVITLKSAKNEVVLKRAGYFVEIGADGVISEPRPLTDEIDKKFAELFIPVNAADGTFARLPGRLPGDFLAGTSGIVNQSGQPTQEGRPLAVNQREFENADQLDGNDTFEATTNLPVAKINYASGAIGFSGGSGDGDYFVNYTLNLAARTFDGSVTVDHQDNNFVTTIPLLHNPFDQGLSLVETGFVLNSVDSFGAPDPNDTFNFAYTISQSGIDTTFAYDEDGAGAAPASTGSGVAPAVP